MEDQHAAVLRPLPGPTRVRDPFAPEPWARRARLLAPKIERDEAQLHSFCRAHLDGDPLADALAAWLLDPQEGDARPLFERALRDGIDSVSAAPEVLDAFFREVERVPLWLDRHKLALAGALYHRTFPAAERVLFSVSLLAGYVSAGIAKTLVGTAQLERMAVRRIAETQSFVTDVYSVNGLARTGAGFQTTVRVRVMHAMVRRQLLQRGFDVTRWGVPINQADMAATALQFSMTYVLGLRALGCHVSAREADAVLHLWRYVGGVMGVRDDLLPNTEQDARRVLRISLASQHGPDDDSRALARALLAVPEQLPVSEAIRKLARIDFAFRAGLTRLVLGGPGADALGLPDGPAKFAPILLFPVVFSAEWLRRHIPFATALAVRLGKHLAEATTNTRLAGKPATYEHRALPRSAAAHGT